MTPRFSHRDPGLPAARWDSWVESLPSLELPPRGESVLVLGAHPDDETLGAGGLIAKAARAGLEVTVLVASDGEASHPGSTTHTPQQLAGRRRTEVAAAIAALAPSARVRLLGLPDGRLAEHTGEIVEVVSESVRPGGLLVTPWWGDGHPDHAACARAAAQADPDMVAAHWQYPIWGWHWGARFPTDPGAAGALDLERSVRWAKRRAMDCHVSQHRPLSAAAGDEAILPAGVLEHFRRDREVYVTASAARREYFDGLYAGAADPWGLRGRFYERRKRALTLASLPQERFARAFEPGCATGLLTEQLAARVDELVAYDIAEAAVEQTRARLGSNPAVSVERGAIPGDWPSGLFDLIVLSEVGYYCADLAALTRRIGESLAPDGILVACHWRQDAPLHPRTAEEVHVAVGQGLRLLATHAEPDFLLQVWDRDGRSVAEREGIVG